MEVIMSNLSIYAEALSANREYKNAKMDGKTLGVINARTWSASVKALRYPAYAIRSYRHANMSNAEVAAPVDMSKFYEAIRVVLDLVGEVNGAKLHAENIAEEIIAHASRIRTIDITNEMAQARFDKRQAKTALNEEENEETLKAYDDACAEVERLEDLPGNCKKLFEINAEAAFVKAVEIVLGDAINKQMMKSLEEVQAEEEARRQARRAKTAAKKAAKKAQA
jgi:hypothetical protein